ncbi:S66 peptidase family protein [Alkaliphilus peptidifermentans]|uniref:Muramoyltetrapeptide carboxypeptidase n=1 Tax=Alkaliphilus peptidifermentans DSM 18978 TaxID=1120976 RepID=A0A1G5IVB5_9FIRM|nr:LD-carboxypeptidase [Alkaliphilus peptidifermentans]SCY79957.1 muramoyltetrapeptide carboxypeptidase [Alkaliphilus peptidifermentans DSM 18978]
MIKPRALKKGDTIAVVAPSSPATPEKVKNAKVQLEALGFNVIMGKSCYEKHGYLSGIDQIRADDINNMFMNKEVDGIICLRGGYGAAKTLEKLDLDMIKANPKVFVGYSDITALHLAMNQICQLITFHGPMAASDIAGGLDDYSKEHIIKAIMEPTPMGILKNPEEIKTQCLVKGKATGEIVGGNLALVTSTMGTPFEINTKGKLLFLEEIGEEPYRVDRMLTQLALAGKLDDAEGIILGDWNNCNPSKHNESLSLMEVFEEIIVPYQKPTVYDLKAGHCTPKLTIPFGVKATLNADEGILIMEEAATI